MRPERKQTMKKEILFWIIYGVSFFVVEKINRDPVWIVHCALDDKIPFWKGAVYFYILWFPYIIYTCVWYLFNERARDNKKLYTWLGWGLFPVLLFYLIVPNGLQLRPTYNIGSGFTAGLVKLIWRCDNPNNVCPSIHVILSFILDRAICESKLGKIKANRWISHIVMILICISTMLLKQHSLIDVVAGFVYGIIVVYGKRIVSKKR